MSYTAKNINDSILNLLKRFKITDEKAEDEDWLYYKINQVRTQLITQDYLTFGKINPAWLSDCGVITLHKVNRADDPTITCTCPIGKAFIPQIIPLQSKEGNLDLGVYNLMSTCSKYQYYYQPMYRWQNIPAASTFSLFKYYFRIDTSLYVSDTPSQLRLIAVLTDPTEGKLIQSAPVTSGSIANGTVYIAKFGGVVYNNVFYAANTTFTGTATATFTTTSPNSQVFLYSQVQSLRETDPFPISADMARAIEIEILTKEFNIEKQAIVDVRNNSADDQNQ